MTALVLNPFNINRAIEKRSYKQDTIHLSNAKNFEMIFILLIEIVVFYIRLTSIYF